MALTNDQKTFITNIAKYVKKYAPTYGIKVYSPIIAQAILESGWGKSGLAKYYNYFGMKCGSSWKGKSVNMNTKEEYEAGTLTSIKANFRAYDNMEAGVKGYFDFINTSRYSNLKGVTDPKKYLENIKADGYATSSTYVESNYKVITTYNLTQYDSNTESTNTGGTKTMSKIENYTAYAEKIAKDDTHGYDQVDRNGNPNFDCSGLVIKAVDQAGIAVKKAGATYTGNLKKAFVACGFTDITKKVTISSGKGLVRGDILLSEGHHVAIYCGSGKMVDARINENGKTTGGKSGDQTGHEIEIHSYSNHPWNCILRYTKEDTATTKNTTSKTYAVGDVVTFTGSVHYPNASKSATGKTCKGGKAKITLISKGSAHPYHLVAVKGGGSTVYGWVNTGTFK